MTRLIDADALKLSHCKECTLYPDNCLGENCDWHSIAHINMMPTVEAEPVRHGKYIGTEFDGYADGCPVYYEWKCSECGCVFEEEEPTYNYCPNCGAKMDERKEE